MPDSCDMDSVDESVKSALPPLYLADEHLSIRGGDINESVDEADIDERVDEADIKCHYEDIMGRIFELTTLNALPTYKPTEVSQDAPLTLIDCHIAILAVIYKARLVVFQIARRSLPVLKRKFRGRGRITLQGDPRKFDVILSSITQEFHRIYFELGYRTARVESVFEKLLVAQKIFQESSSTCLLHLKD